MLTSSNRALDDYPSFLDVCNSDLYNRILFSRRQLQSAIKHPSTLGFQLL